MTQESESFLTAKFTPMKRLHWIGLLLAVTSSGDISDPRLIALHVFGGQKTATFLQKFRSHHIVTAFIPEGCTRLVQPMDVSINKPLKDNISELLDEEMERNPKLWDGEFSVSDRRIVIIRIVADAWHWLTTSRTAATYYPIIFIYWTCFTT